MNEVNDTATKAVGALQSRHLESRLCELQHKWRTIWTSVRRDWRLGKTDLTETITWLKTRIAALHEAIDGDEKGDDLFSFREPIDDLWGVLLIDATPGTKMWAEMWKRKPSMQQLTIHDLLIAFAAIKLDHAAVLLTQRTHRTPEAELALADAYVRDAEEALRVTK